MCLEFVFVCPGLSPLAKDARNYELLVPCSSVVDNDIHNGVSPRVTEIPPYDSLGQTDSETPAGFSNTIEDSFDVIVSES